MVSTSFRGMIQWLMFIKPLTFEGLDMTKEQGCKENASTCDGEEERKTQAFVSSTVLLGVAGGVQWGASLVLVIERSHPQRIALRLTRNFALSSFESSDDSEVSLDDSEVSLAFTSSGWVLLRLLIANNKVLCPNLGFTSGKIAML